MGRIVQFQSERQSPMRSQIIGIVLLFPHDVLLLLVNIEHARMRDAMLYLPVLVWISLAFLSPLAAHVVFFKKWI
jgi:hypothetical protein